ncbi:hypothetical protein [Streptomyces adustus]
MAVLRVWTSQQHRRTPAEVKSELNALIAEARRRATLHKSEKSSSRSWSVFALAGAPVAVLFVALTAFSKTLH